MIITLPEVLDSRVFHASIQIIQEVEEDVLIIDFTPVKFSKPFGALLLAETLRNVRRRRSNMGLQPAEVKYIPNSTVVSYLSHIGFFQHSGVELGNEPGEAIGSGTYLPIHYVTRRSLLKMTHNDDLLGPAIEKESAKLAGIILGLEPTGVTTTHPVSYCFREVIRNTFEHADANSCTVCAQKWDDRRIQIALLDTGRGIRASLNEKYHLATDQDALTEAIKPGISRADFNEQTDSIWSNSGFGLYVLSELAARTGGFFEISSGISGLIKNKYGQFIHSHTFDGTAICFEIHKPTGVDMVALHRQIIKEGEKQAPQKSMSASASSKRFG